MRKVMLVVACVAAALLGMVNTAQASVAAEPVSEVGVLDANCTYPLCGRVQNLTGRWLQLSQNYKSGGGCVGPYAGLAPGANSYKNPYKDTDCFRSNECSVFYQGWHSPGQWIRIHNLPTPVVVVSLSC